MPKPTDSQIRLKFVLHEGNFSPVKVFVQDSALLGYRLLFKKRICKMLHKTIFVERFSENEI